MKRIGISRPSKTERLQLKSPKTHDTYFKLTDNQTVVDTERGLRNQVRGLVDSHEQPPTIEDWIDSWLNTRDQTVITMRKKVSLLKPIFAVEKCKKLDLFLEESNADIHSWYAFFCWCRRQTRRHIANQCILAVRNGAKSHIKAGQSSCTLETTMMVAENECGSPLGLS